MAFDPVEFLKKNKETESTFNPVKFLSNKNKPQTAPYDESVPTDENLQMEGRDPYKYIKDPSFVEEGQALIEVPIQLGSDIASGVSAGTRKSASKINLIPQIILSKITGQNMIDQSALEAANKPLMQMYDESALQYDASPLGKRRYESFLDNLAAIPAFNELRSYNMLNKGRKESEFFNAAKNQELIKQTKKYAPQNKVLQESAKEGYVVTPSKVKNASKKDLASESAGGKYVTEEVARFKNQQVTDGLVRKYLGLADDAALDQNTLNVVRKKHGKAYESIEKLKGKVDVKTTGTGGLYNKPQTTKTIIHRDGKNILDDIKIARDAERELWKNYRFGPNAGKKQQLDEARKMSDEVIQLEKELDGLLAYHKKPELAKKLKQARQDIAKVYLVDDAMTATGNIDARRFSQALKKKYMTGEAKKIAKFADQYPDLAKVPKSQTLKDVTKPEMAFILAEIGAGNFKTAAAALLNPLTKSRLFTKGAQERIINSQLNPTNFQGSMLLAPPTKKQYAAEGLGLASLLDPYFNR
jgi:hypothetical protein